MSKDAIDIHIGSRLRLLRTQRKMTLQEAGDGVRMTYQQIRKYELGTNRVSASTLYRLSELLGVEPSFFFEGLPRRDAVMEEALDRANDPDLQAVLGRIDDIEVRRHLEGLIKILEARKKA